MTPHEPPEAPHVGYCDSRTDEERANEPKSTTTSTHVGALSTQDILDEFEKRMPFTCSFIREHMDTIQNADTVIRKVSEDSTLQQERYKEKMRGVLECFKKDVLKEITERMMKYDTKDGYSSLYDEVLEHANQDVEDIINKKIENLT